MKVILSLSGGLDSAVLLWYLLKERNMIRCLSVNYGQRHKKELLTAVGVVQAARDTFGQIIEHQVADLCHLDFLFAGSSQTIRGPEVPEGHYTDQSMKQTIVPNRNMVFISLAGAWAVATRSNAVAYAAHAGDHAIYPDCRPEFTEQMEDALRLCDWHPIELLRPFLIPTPMNKTDIVRLGSELRVPFHLTWSCYKGLYRHCGKCGTCVERREAFEQSGVRDLTEYE